MIAKNVVQAFMQNIENEHPKSQCLPNCDYTQLRSRPLTAVKCARTYTPYTQNQHHEPNHDRWFTRPNCQGPV